MTPPSATRTPPQASLGEEKIAPLEWRAPSLESTLESRDQAVAHDAAQHRDDGAGHVGRHAVDLQDVTPGAAVGGVGVDAGFDHAALDLGRMHDLGLADQG